MVHNTQQGRRAAKRPGAGRRAGGKIFRGSPLKLVLGLLELPNRVSSVALAESEDERRNPESIWSLANWWTKGGSYSPPLFCCSCELQDEEEDRRIHPAMERRGSGSGGRKWAVELCDAAPSSSARDVPPDPLGFSRSSTDLVCCSFLFAHCNVVVGRFN